MNYTSFISDFNLQPVNRKAGNSNAIISSPAKKFPLSNYKNPLEDDKSVSRELRSELKKTTYTSKSSRKYNKNSPGQSAPNDKQLLPKCHLCKSTMRVMRNRKGKDFYSCSTYPECKGARNTYYYKGEKVI